MSGKFSVRIHCRRIFFVSVFVFLFFLFPFKSHALVYFEDDFDGYSGNPWENNHGWTINGTSAITVHETGGRGDNGRCISFHFNGQTGSSGYFFGTDPNPSGNFNPGYLRFSFKVLNHSGGQIGTKFYKLFTDLHNLEYYSHYTGTFISNIQTGDGSAAGDSNCRWDYDGESSVGCVHSTYTGISPSINDSEWHTYEIYFKQNTDNNYDGELRAWFDGVEHLNVTGIMVRHPSSPTDITLMHLAAYAYNISNGDNDWDLYFDDVATSDSYIGPPNLSTNKTPPATPNDLSVL